MKLRSLVALSCCLALTGPVAAKAQDVFNFDSISPAGNVFLTSGTPMTSGSTTVTFTPVSTGGNDIAFDFESAANYGALQSGTVLVDASGLPGDSLLMTFAQPITSFALDYAITDFSTGPYTMTVAGNSITGPGEGLYTLPVGAPVSSVLLTFSGSTTFALDNITVSTVPEPGTVALALALGLPVAWGVRRKLARK